MAWDDYRPESVADLLKDAGRWVTAGGLAVVVVGVVAGLPSLVAAAALVSFAGAIVPPALGILEIQSRPDTNEEAAWPCDAPGKSACPPVVECEAGRKFQDLVVTQKKQSARPRLP